MSGEIDGHAAPLARERLRRREVSRAGRSLGALQLGNPFVAAFQIDQLAPQGVAARRDPGHRRPVFPLQPLEQRQPFFDLLKPRRRRLDGVGVAAQEHRQASRRLDALARIQKRLKPRIEGGEIGDAAPHPAKAREHGGAS